MLPFSHKPLRESDGNPWTDYWVIVLALDVNHKQGLAGNREFNNSRWRLLRAEVNRIQPGMDMYFSHGGAKKMSPLGMWLNVLYPNLKPDSAIIKININSHSLL